MGEPTSKKRPSKTVFIFVFAGIVLILAVTLFISSRVNASFFSFLGGEFASPEFDSAHAYQDVAYQVSLGPRLPGSQAHQQTQEWIQSELEKAGWDTELQSTTMDGHPLTNIIARRGAGRPWLVLGAHYDTRLHADRDPDLSKLLEPVPGANDGASGVAVLLELARQLPKFMDKNSFKNSSGVQTIWLVFFDLEDNGNIEGWDWLLGSQAFVANLKDKPDAAVILDMIGDKNLKIYQEEQSDQKLSGEIWKSAEAMGYQDYFIPFMKYSILDDHVPFLKAGIPAVDIIDIEYPYWHTTADTADKVSPQSLEIVGKTLLHWLLDRQIN